MKYDRVLQYVKQFETAMEGAVVDDVFGDGDGDGEEAVEIDGEDS